MILHLVNPVILSENFKMKKTKLLDQQVLLRKAARILLRELGPVEAMRFFALLPKMHIDAVKRHRDWQKNLKPDEFFDAIFH